MSYIIRQSTALTVAIGPFVDNTDGFTPETSLTISQADVRLSKNGAAFAQKNESSSSSHMENGYYSCALNTTDTDTVGVLTLHVNESGALPVFHEFQVVEEAIYDALFAASATGALPVSSGGIVAGSFAAGAIDNAAIAANAIGASELATDAVEEIRDSVWTASSRVLTAGTNIVLAKGTGVTGFNDPTAADNAAAVLTSLKGQDRRGTAQGAGSGSNTLVLAVGDQEADDFYNGGLVVLLEGAGTTTTSVSARTRRIVDYVNSTNQIVVDSDWAEAVDNTTVYLIMGG